MVKVCVGGILLRGRMILLGKRAAERSFFPNVWDVFGGHVEAHEALDQALVREFEEELGIIPTEFTRLELVHDANAEQGDTYQYHIYLITAWTGTPTNRLPDEHSEIGWFSLEQARQLDLAHPSYPALFHQVALQTESDWKG